MSSTALKIPLSAPDVGDRELRYVEQVMRSGSLSLGPMLPRFEEEFAATIGRKFAIAVNSGTSALHLCVRAAGIGPAHEVITTSFSFVASTNCLLYENAVPVFVDIDAATLNISPAQIEEFLRNCCARNAQGRLINRATGREVKAILPVHVFGLPSDMQAIGDLAAHFVAEGQPYTFSTRSCLVRRARSSLNFASAGLTTFSSNTSISRSTEG